MEDFRTKAAKSEKVTLEYRRSLAQIFAVSVKNTILLNFGISLGFPTILIPAISGGDPSEKIILGPESISWISSINLICAPVGCFLSGYLTQAIGRRTTMQIVTIPFLAAWLLFYFSTKVWQIFLASCLTGLSGGLLEAPVLTYVAEISEPHLRGILTSTNTASIVLGIFLQFLIGTFYQWRMVTLMNCAFPLISFTLLMLIPETPVWLITKNKLPEARKSLAWLRGWTTIDKTEIEFQELYKQTKLAEHEGDTTVEKLQQIKLYTKRNFIWPFLLTTFCFILCHFNGNTPLQAYAIKIFKAFDVPLSEYYSTMIMGLVQLLGCIASISLIRFFGKRVINFISLLGAGICLMIVGSYAFMKDIKYLNMPNEPDTTLSGGIYQWIPVTFLVLSTFFSYFGTKILPWVLIGEIFYTEIRATASGLSACIGYIIGFLANKVFLDMVDNFTLPGVFWFYGSVCIVGTVVLYFILPETEGKSLFEITEHFAGRIRLRNSVRRRRTGSCGACENKVEHGATESSL